MEQGLIRLSWPASAPRVHHLEFDERGVMGEAIAGEDLLDAGSVAKNRHLLHQTVADEPDDPRCGTTLGP